MSFVVWPVFMKRKAFNQLLTSTAVVLLPFVLSGCETSRYAMKHDTGPSRPVSVSHIPDAKPRLEPRTIAGNKSPYKVLGKTYHVLSTPDNYSEQGIASWYGEKFHGHLTSNGEIYNMYGMTAAHKTLPIPSYVRVTNKQNGHTVIVRVNDRGPFHDNRVIDLTYTAAKKLGFLDRGTALVQVDYIDPTRYVPESDVMMAKVPHRPNHPPAPKTAVPSDEPVAPTPVNSGGYAIPDNTFLQVGAFTQRQSAIALQMKLEELTRYPVAIFEPSPDNLYRVRIGPLKDNFDLLSLRQKLAEANLPEPHVVYQ